MNRDASYRPSRCTALAGLLVALFAGCLGGGGGSESFQGAAVLRGFVTEFEAGGEVFTGGVDGVVVTVIGTELTTTTASDGLFVIAGVPPGQTLLEFAFLDTAARFPLSVPEDTEVHLNQVRVRQGQVQVSGIEVNPRSPPMGSPGAGSPPAAPESASGPGPMGNEDAPGPRSPQ